MTKEQRRDAASKFKEIKPPMGVYSIRFGGTTATWVGASRNLTAAKNSLMFGLRIGSHRDRALQSAWNATGESALEFKVLEVLDEETPTLNIADVLKARKHHWQTQLTAHDLL
jgi:hypothetical protein